MTEAMDGSDRRLDRELPGDEVPDEQQLGDAITADETDPEHRDDEDEVFPLDCIDTESENLGQRCPHCERPECEVLAAGRLIVEQQTEIAELKDQVEQLTRQNEQHEQDKLHLLERILGLQTDTLVETAFTPEGLKDHMEHDPDLIEELQEKKWGVIRLDARFVKFMNRFGNLVGDDFLEMGGEHITALADGLIRVTPRRVADTQPDEERRTGERRAGHALTMDIICRQGGDEFALLIRNISPRDLVLVASRIQARLTVSSAVDRYTQGNIPFIASVGLAHAQEMEPEITSDLAQNNPWMAFRRITGLADEGQRATREHQYQEMWNMVMSGTPHEERHALIAQPDDNVVAEQFLRLICPDFFRDPASFLQQR